MAIYRLEVKPISRGAGKSIVAAAAYRSGQELTNPRDGMVHDYSKRGGVEHEQLVGWEGSRQELWGRTEEIETRKNARLGVETIVSLPHELDADARRELAAGFAQELAAAYRAPVDFAVHTPHEKGDERNHHAHILVGCRRSDGRELGERVVPFNGPEEVERWRGRWAELCNERLQERGLEERVDHRTLAVQRDAALERGDERAARDLDRDPEPKVGSPAMALERRGIRTDRGDRRRETVALNAERGRLWDQVRELGRQVKERSLALGQDVAGFAERTKAAFRRGSEFDAPGEAGVGKPMDAASLAERAKAAFREKQEATRAAERAKAMAPFEQQAHAFEIVAKRAAKAAERGLTPAEERNWSTWPEPMRKAVNAFNRSDEPRRAAFKTELSNGLAQAAGVTPMKSPGANIVKFIGAFGPLLQAIKQAAEQSQDQPDIPKLPSLASPERERDRERDMPDM